MWGKIWSDNHLINDCVAENDDYSMSRTSMVLKGLEDICHDLDLEVPLWFDSNISDFQLHDKTRFNADNFIEKIDFDYLEIQVIEE